MDQLEFDFRPIRCPPSFLREFCQEHLISVRDLNKPLPDRILIGFFCHTHTRARYNLRELALVARLHASNVFVRESLQILEFTYQGRRYWVKFMSDSILATHVGLHFTYLLAQQGINPPTHLLL